MEVVPRRHFQNPIILAAFSEAGCRDLHAAGKGNIVREKKASAWMGPWEKTKCCAGSQHRRCRQCPWNYGMSCGGRDVRTMGSAGQWSGALDLMSGIEARKIHRRET